MSFLASMLWALLTVANPGLGFGHGYAPSTIAPVHGLHHAKGGMRPMDTNSGGPTAPSPTGSP